MNKSVSNDALWEKLSEIDERLNRYLMEQEKTVHGEEEAEITAQLKENKNQIADLFKKGLQGLGTHYDSHFSVIHKDSEQFGKLIQGVHGILSCMWRWMQEKEKEKSEPDKSYVNFKLFKVRKTSLTITTLGLLVFILMVFSMKQQNDYSLLNSEYYRQGIVTRELQIELDSLKNTLTNQNAKKK